MSNFLVPRYRATDVNGTPVSGAKLHFYESGTTTPLATYSDASLETANTNPVVADGAGYFPRIYMQESAYRVVLTDAADVTVWTQDDVTAAALSGSLSRMRELASTPLDYDGVGDGVADDSAAVQAAIDGASGLVDLLGRTYRCDSSLLLKSGLTIRNGELDFAQCDDDSYLVARGTTYPFGLIAADALTGATALTLPSVGGIAPGDTMILSSAATHLSSGSTREEIVQVVAVESPVLTLAAPLAADYLTSDSAQVTLLDPVTDVVLEDVTITAAKDAVGDGDAVKLEVCDRVSLRNCTIRGFRRAGVSVSKSRNILIDACRIEDGATGSHGLTLYAEASAGIFVGKGTVIQSVGTGIALGSGQEERDGGVLRNVVVDGCVIAGCSAHGIAISDGAQHVGISGTTIASLSTASGVLADGCDDVRIWGCTMLGGVQAIDDDGATGLMEIGNARSGQSAEPSGALPAAAFAVSGTVVSGAAATFRAHGGAEGSSHGVVGSAPGSGSGVVGVAGAEYLPDGVTPSGGTFGYSADDAGGVFMSETGPGAEGTGGSYVGDVGGQDANIGSAGAIGTGGSVSGPLSQGGAGVIGRAGTSDNEYGYDGPGIDCDGALMLKTYVNSLPERAPFNGICMFSDTLNVALIYRTTTGWKILAATGEITLPS